VVFALFAFEVMVEEEVVVVVLLEFLISIGILVAATVVEGEVVGEVIVVVIGADGVEVVVVDVVVEFEVLVIVVVGTEVVVVVVVKVVVVFDIDVDEFETLFLPDLEFFLFFDDDEF
jgi:hypothetical protein